MGCAEIVMPENYIALFNAPERKQAVKIIKNADIVIKNTADVIKHNGTIPEKKVSAFAKAGSGVINTLFYPLIVSAKKFYVTDACIGCGACERGCPTENIRLNAGTKRPEWDDNCALCLHCYHYCPTNAIAYGKNTGGKGQYRCPDDAHVQG